ncbi:CPBP family intramembrane glutamic endopeptidase [Acidicapsa acidisoli]|uniref:CPBP family intramembrane glutamic endopeptidase n=1 Tax=Acidicapsa acidisoli TaxID=1615681 RepID=UPI0021DFA8D5|nr:CPBP family intramembrane glutamic endopeptidase [Acidicapsa acidisoli]
MRRVLLVLELLIVFIGLPLGYRFSPVRIPALPVLWLVAGYALWQLMRDRSFDRRQLWNTAPLAGHLGAILLIFAVVALGLWVGTHWMAPQLEWGFVRQHPRLWAAVMVLYPVLSVYPQGILYRAFFLHRYAGLFSDTAVGRWVLIVASAAAFGFLHIIFRNSLAVGLTFCGGVLFAWRYAETGSLLTSSVEHALYGCWLFTVGLGQYFYHGVWPEPK